MKKFKIKLDGEIFVSGPFEDSVEDGKLEEIAINLVENHYDGEKAKNILGLEESFEILRS